MKGVRAGGRGHDARTKKDKGGGGGSGGGEGGTMQRQQRRSGGNGRGREDGRRGDHTARKMPSQSSVGCLRSPMTGNALAHLKRLWKEKKVHGCLKGGCVSVLVGAWYRCARRAGAQSFNCGPQKAGVARERVCEKRWCGAVQGKPFKNRKV